MAIKETTPTPEEEGAAAFIALLRHVGDVSNATCVSFYEDELIDERDYLSLAEAALQSIEQNMLRATPAQREGYLRALADLLAHVADGALPDVESWDPIATTAASFSAPKMARDTIARVARGQR